MTELIEVKLEHTNVFTLWPCTVCGGHTEKVGVLAEARDTTNGGRVIRVCENCLQAGDIDARLEEHAAYLQCAAEKLRALIGRLKVPTYEDWKAEMRLDDIQWLAASGTLSPREEARLRNNPSLPLPEPVPGGLF